MIRQIMKVWICMATLALWSGVQVSAEDFETATEAVRNMRVGWNLGNTLDSHSGDTLNMWIEADKNRTVSTYEKAWGQPLTKPSLMKMLQQAGFGAVRVPVTWYPHMEATFSSVKGYTNAEGKWVYTPWLPSSDFIGTKIDPLWMKRVRQVVDGVMNQGMYCILNIHHDTGASNVAWLIADEAVYEQQKERFEAVWRQIAEEFKDYDERLIFEGYNEMLDVKNSWCFASFAAPNQYDSKIATSAYNAINSYAQSFVNAVRSTGGNNAQRNLIVSTYGACDGSGNWNPHLKDPLKQMRLPQDHVENHLIFEVHSYPEVKNLADAKTHVDRLMEDLNTHLVQKGAPVIIGEWGTSTHDAYNTYRDNLLAYSTYMVQQAKANDMATFHWMGLSDGNFRSVPHFNQPDLKDAIVKGYYGEQGYQSSVASPAVLPKSADVYDLGGTLLFRSVSTQDLSARLPRNIYVVNGKKVSVQ